MDQTTVIGVVETLKKSLLSSGVKLDHIALFGSCVSGSTHEESDIDIILISADFEGKDIFERFYMTEHAEMETRKKFQVPLDILTMTPEEFEKSLSGKFFNAKLVA
jgi:uncharacterized protein